MSHIMKTPPRWQKQHPLRGWRDCLAELGPLAKDIEKDLNSMSSDKWAGYISQINGELYYYDTAIQRKFKPVWKELVQVKYPDTTWKECWEWIQDIFFELNRFVSEGSPVGESNNRRLCTRKDVDQPENNQNRVDMRRGTRQMPIELGDGVVSIPHPSVERNKIKKEETPPKETRESMNNLHSNLHPNAHVQILKRRVTELREQNKRLKQAHDEALLAKVRLYEMKIKSYEERNKSLQDALEDLNGTESSDDEMMEELEMKWG